MYYGLSLLLAGLLLRLLLALDKAHRPRMANVRHYDSFAAYRNNRLLRAAGKLLGLLSVLAGVGLIGLWLAGRSI